MSADVVVANRAVVCVLFALAHCTSLKLRRLTRVCTQMLGIGVVKYGWVVCKKKKNRMLKNGKSIRFHRCELIHFVWGEYKKCQLFSEVFLFGKFLRRLFIYGCLFETFCNRYKVDPILICYSDTPRDLILITYNVIILCSKIVCVYRNHCIEFFSLVVKIHIFSSDKLLCYGEN